MLVWVECCRVKEHPVLYNGAMAYGCVAILVAFSIEDKFESDPNMRTLTVMKPNWSAKGEQIKMEWCEGYLRYPKWFTLSGHEPVRWWTLWIWMLRIKETD